MAKESEDPSPLVHLHKGSAGQGVHVVLYIITFC